MSEDSSAQQEWWESMTDEQREAYEDAVERRRAHREAGLEVGWVIDRDHVADTRDESRIGYGQVAGQAEESAATRIVNAGTVYMTTELMVSDVADPVRFRTLDDDGEVYYCGAIARSWLEGDEERSLAPLTFAHADAGAICMQYRDGNAWKVL